MISRPFGCAAWLFIGVALGTVPFAPADDNSLTESERSDLALGPSSTKPQTTRREGASGFAARLHLVAARGFLATSSTPHAHCD